MPRPSLHNTDASNSIFYDAKTSLTMPRLDSGFTDMKKVVARKTGFGEQGESCINSEKAV